MIKALLEVQPPCQASAGRATQVMERVGGRVPALGETRSNPQNSNKDAKNLPREVKHAHEACGLTDSGWSRDQDTGGSSPWMSHCPV